MLPLLTSPTLLKTCGLLGSLIVLFGAVLPGLAYCGRQGERYSPFNHYISELGEVGVSRLARVFNLGLILGGLLFLPVSLGLGLMLPGWWAKLGMLAGCVACIAVALVGVFPMNQMHNHILAAMTYFRSGLAMVLFFSLAVALQPAGQAVIHRASLGMGVVSAGCYAAFLVLGRRPEVDEGEEEGEVLDPLALPRRPRFWLLPTLEWAIFATSILWFFVIAVAVEG